MEWLEANRRVIRACKAATALWEARTELQEATAVNPLATDAAIRDASGENVLAVPIGFPVIGLDARKLKAHVERMPDGVAPQSLIELCDATISLWTVAHEERCETTRVALGSEECSDRAREAAERHGLDYAAWPGSDRAASAVPVACVNPESLAEMLGAAEAQAVAGEANTIASAISGNLGRAGQ